MSLHHLTLRLVLLVSLNLIACAHKVTIDKVTDSAIMQGDATVIMSGCGNQPIAGFTYCRQSENDMADDSLTFIGPPAKCNQTACVYFKVWNENGMLVWGGSIPKGQTQVQITWKQLLGHDEYQISDRGMWTVNETVYWLDNEGREHMSSAQGDMVLRIFKSGYLPLNQIDQDPNFYWVWGDKDNTYRMTTGLRSNVTKNK